MANTYPTSLNDFTNPSGTDKVSNAVGGRKHADFHADINDAVEALEAKVGIDGSAVTTSHDYKLSEVTAVDKAVGKAATQTLTNKTLTLPKVGTAITDTNGNEVIKTPATGSAINEITVTNAAIGNDPQVSATGDDANIGLKVKGKGTGKVKLGAADLAFPNADGAANQVIKTDGSGTLSFVSQSASPSAKTLVPYPNRNMINCASTTNIQAYAELGSDTTMLVGQVSIHYEIIVNKIIFMGARNTGDGTFKFAIFSEDGQARHINESVTLSASAGVNTIHTLSSPVTLSPGVYYVAVVVATSGATIQLIAWLTNVGDGTTFLNAPTGLPVIEGTITVTAQTIPTTINPASITGAINKTLAFRLDN